MEQGSEFELFAKSVYGGSRVRPTPARMQNGFYDDLRKHEVNKKQIKMLMQYCLETTLGICLSRFLCRTQPTPLPVCNCSVTIFQDRVDAIVQQGNHIRQPD